MYSLLSSSSLSLPSSLFLSVLSLQSIRSALFIEQLQAHIFDNIISTYQYSAKVFNTLAMFSMLWQIFNTVGIHYPLVFSTLPLGCPHINISCLVKILIYFWMLPLDEYLPLISNSLG